MENVCGFSAIFDKSDVFSDGNLKMRFESPFSDIAQVIQTVMVVDVPFKVEIYKEDVDEPYIIINENQFWKLQVYKDGNAKFEFKCDPKSFDRNKLSQIIEENVRLEVYKQ